MLFSAYPVITIRYFIFSFVICLGTLQWAAARNQKLSINIMGLGWVGGLLVIAGFVWYFGFTPGLFLSGLAGGELSTLFILAGICALVVSRLVVKIGQLWYY